MKSKIANLINWGLPYCAIAAMAYLIMFPQLVSHGVILGTDSIFHFNRFMMPLSKFNSLILAIFKVIIVFNKVVASSMPFMAPSLHI